MSMDELKPLVGQETIESFYTRIDVAIASVLKRAQPTDHILIVTHAAVMDASIKSMRKCPPTAITDVEMLHMGTFYPYSSVVSLAYSHDEWSFIFDIIPPITYLGVSNRVDANFIDKTTRFKTTAAAANDQKGGEIKGNIL